MVDSRPSTRQVKKTRFQLLCLLAAIVAGLNAADVETNKKLIQGTWYCPAVDLTHRFEFAADDKFMEWSYIPTANGQRRWSANYSDRVGYVFSSASKLQTRMDELSIQSLTPTLFRFTWGPNSYQCTRTPPRGDTAESRAAAAAAKDLEKQAFLGRWVSVDKTRYVDFLNDDVCTASRLEGGRWVTSTEKSRVYHDGKDIMCGDGGMYSREGDNSLTFTYGMRDIPVRFNRAFQEAEQVHPAISYRKEGGAHILRVDLTDLTLRFQTVLANDRGGPADRETVQSIAERYGAIAAINTDYFGVGHGPEGMAYINGREFQKNNCRTSLAISDRNAADISRDHGSGRDLKYTVVGGGPLLLSAGIPVWKRGGSAACAGCTAQDVINGECYPSSSYWDQGTVHTGAAISRDGRTLILAVSETTMRPQEMARILADQGGYTAIKFDGGRSSSMYYNGKVLKSGWPVAEALLVLRRLTYPPQELR
jgi:hypothetical protein